MRRYLVRVAFAVWLVLCTVGAGTLMASHWYTLPKPSADDARMLGALDRLRPADAEGRWFAVHVLYSSCPCSVRVLDHLFSRPRPDDLVEVVLLVEPDTDLETRARAAGFSVTVVTPEALASAFGIEAAPLMLVQDPAHRLRYSGGYTERKQDPDIRDLAILQALRDETSHTVDLPLFGCAVSLRLQDVLDPLKLKYE